MNIGQLIENPFQDLSSYTADLEKLMQKNSYSSTIMMLYLKALKDSSSIDFEDNLKKTAILCQDRTVLFDFIKKENLQSAPILEKIEKVVDEQPDNVEPEKPEVLEALSEVKTENVDIPPTEKEIKKEEPATQDSESNESTHEEKDESIFELNKDIYARAVHASIHDEEDEDVDETSTEPKETTLTEKKEPEVEEKEDKQPIAEEPAKEQSSVTKHTGEKLSFIDWLKAQQGQNIEANKSSKQSVKEDDQPDSLEEQNTENKDVNTDNYRSDINDIVEKFIKEEPTITRRKAEFFSPSETAKKSIEENDTIVTETLAEIYVNQGNYKKAIAAYEQLILKFPKKKSFFADRINFIKSLK